MTVDALLDFIAWPESRGDYNAIWGGIKKEHKPKKPITQMTIGQVLDWQDSIDALYNSEASGAWQFMEDTLRGLYREAGLALSDRFSEENQRKLAIALLRRRGLDDYLSGKITAVRFANNLSKEWASLPCTIKDRKGRPAQGQSYYAGDGLNKSHVTISQLMKAVNEVKAEPVRPDVEPAIAPEATSGGIGAIIAAILKAIFGGKK